MQFVRNNRPLLSLFYSAAPFIATKLIQNLVTSNPSPRYVRAAADAFRLGRYSANGINFGSGGYGDLEATVAVIMLDSEARAATLDDDANHGRSREPLLKIMHLLRSMQRSSPQRRVSIVKLIWLIYWSVDWAGGTSGAFSLWFLFERV